jgi:hypothetical protein
MAGKILDNGTLITLGLVGVVAAVGAANKAGLYGSTGSAARSRKPVKLKKPAVYRYRRTPTAPGMYTDVEMPKSLIDRDAYHTDTFIADVNTNDANWTKGAWIVTVGSGYSAVRFLVFGISENTALANAIDLAVEVAPGWTTESGDPDLEEALEQYDGEGYATEDGSVYLGHFDSLEIQRLGPEVRTLLAEKGISLR